MNLSLKIVSAAACSVVVAVAACVVTVYITAKSNRIRGLQEEMSSVLTQADTVIENMDVNIHKQRDN